MLVQTTGQLSSRLGSRTRPPRIAFLGLFGGGNLGNEGSLKALLTSVRQARPDAELSCICVVPDKVRSEHGLEPVLLNWRARSGLLAMIDSILFRIPSAIIDAIRTLLYVYRLDAIIVPGTGILDDFGAGPFGVPLGLFKWALCARVLRVPFDLVSIGAGPIHHPLSRWLMKSTARLATYRSYRDTLSRNFMLGIGFDASRDPVYPDVAFKLEAARTARPTAPEGAPLTVGLGVMTYYGWYQDPATGQHVYDAYLDRIAEFAGRLLDRGHNIRVLTGESTDSQAVDALMARLTQSHPELARTRVLAEPPHSLDDLMRQIGDTDVVVATRFHNVVCALKMGRPVISLGYAKKNDVLLAEMGLAEFNQPIEGLDVDRLEAQFDRLCADRKGHEERITATVRRFADELRAQDAVLAIQFAALPPKPAQG